MIIGKKIKNNIEYTSITHENNPSKKELIKALDIIHKSKYCIVFYHLYNSNKLGYTYYKNGKVHNDFGFAMCNGDKFYGINGEISQSTKYEFVPNIIKKFRMQLRKEKLEKISQKISNKDANR